MTSRQTNKNVQRLAIWLLPTLFSLTALVLVGATWLMIRAGRPAYLLFRDPAAIGGINPLAGVFSSLGVLMWCSTAAVSLFVAAIFWKLEEQGGSWRFFAAAGLLSSMLLLDDFFMVHEYVEGIFSIPQAALYGGYLMALIAFLAFFWRQIRESDFALLLIAAGFLSLSAATDVVAEHFDPKDTFKWRIMIEDGAKLLGILAWSSYYLLTAARHLLQLCQRWPPLSPSISPDSVPTGTEEGKL